MAKSKLVLRPKLLLLPTIPEPLHGVNPRTILGQAWWEKTRQAAYRSTGYRCLACGVSKHDALYRQWLEGHEVYHTDYERAILTYVETVPLCHCCHNYIHKGRLQMLLSQRKITHGKFAAIMQHGERVLSEAGLTPEEPHGGPTTGNWVLNLSILGTASVFLSKEKRNDS